MQKLGLKVTAIGFKVSRVLKIIPNFRPVNRARKRQAELNIPFHLLNFIVGDAKLYYPLDLSTF